MRPGLKITKAVGADNMAQQIKELAVNPDDPSSIPRSPRWKEGIDSYLLYADHCTLRPANMDNLIKTQQ